VKSILVATDGSASADRAVELAASLAAAGQAELVIITIPEGLPSDTLRAYSEVEHVSADEAVDLAARSVLFHAQERAKGCGVGNVSAEVVSGEPAEAILKMAAKTDPGAIVVGRRGRGRLAGLLLGSVSHKLVNLAPCPVVVVP
jgi:nucleotide-binding universal stress UspA family protein